MEQLLKISEKLEPRRDGVVSLARDLSSWGREVIRRVQRLTRRHGVVCSSTIYSDGKAG